MLLSTALAFCTVGGSVRANEILAGAQITGKSLGHGEYTYALTLQNFTNSSSQIGLFWFAWEAGQADFLASQPTDIQTPPGWEATVEGGGDDDGFSVQFVSYTNALQPGSSITFNFDSTDSPKIMAEPAEFYPEYTTLTSQVFSGHEASGLQEVIIAKLLETDLGSITVRPIGSELILSWTSGTNVVLQQSVSLSATNWATVSGTQGRGTYFATNLPSAPAVFYRLATQ
jgi:hypothetical protein